MTGFQITDDMLHPDNWRKMHVRKLERLFSMTNVHGMHIYRNLDAKKTTEKRIKEKFLDTEHFRHHK